MKRRTRLALSGVAAGVVLLALGIAAIFLRDGEGPRVRADEICERYASPDGSDGAAGTAEQPYESVQTLVDSLASGETGCLLAGTFPGDVSIRRGGITLTSARGAQATLAGRLEIEDSANDVTVSDLAIDGSSSDEVTVQIFGDRVRLLRSEVTNRDREICIVVGDDTYGVAYDFLAEGNRVHDCGSGESGMKDHGFYLSTSRRARILNNAIYDGEAGAGWGIHLYPDADETLIAHNVIDGNGGGIVISSHDDKASDDNVIRDNVISNSLTTYNLEDEVKVAMENLVEHNCFWKGHLGNLENSGGYVARRNIVADPLYVDRDAKDFHLRPDSRCAGTGLH